MMTKKGIAFLIICLFFTAVITSACGDSGKNMPTDNSAYYYILAQQNTGSDSTPNQTETSEESPTPDQTETATPLPTVTETMPAPEVTETMPAPTVTVTGTPVPVVTETMFH